MGGPSEGDIQGELIGRLDALFGAFPIGKLTDVSPLIEDFIRDYLVDVMAKHISELSDDGQYLGMSGRILLNGAPHQIVAAPDIWSPVSLQVAFLPEEGSPSKRRPRSLRASLDGIGRYQTVDIFVHPELSVHRESLRALVDSVFRTGYAWLEETLARILRDEQVSMSRELYSLIRTLIPHESLWSKIWCWSVTRDEAFYLPDSQLIAAGLPAMRRDASVVGTGTVDMIGAFLNTVMPFDRTNTKEAITSDRCIDVDLSAAGYRTDETAYLLAELAIFGGDSLSIWPVIRTGRTLLVIGFPTEIKQDVLLTLENNKREIEKRFQLSRSRIRRLLHLLTGTRPMAQTGQLAELTGRFVRGIMGFE